MRDETTTLTTVPNGATTGTGRALVRQLSAIVFTDMVGYTALMQEDDCLLYTSPSPRDED